jgi:putative Holliday junction resolvase
MDERGPPDRVDAARAVPAAGRVLGLDLGERRIGVATSDAGRVLASPRTVIERHGRGPDRSEDHRAILALAREEEAVASVVGLPLSLDGTLGPAAQHVLAEVDALRALAEADGIAVVVHDERLTTVTAEAALLEARMRREARRRVVDKVAAAVMLQSWLDSVPNSMP